jgi:NhaP-type Na+/H+ or K+/H+ antiporter
MAAGNLAVTITGVWIANANLPSYEELRRFKEHATVLLVSGVFVLLAASIDIGSIMALDLRALAFIAAIILLARPITVYLSLLGTKFLAVSAHWWHSQARVGLCWSLWRDCLANDWLPWALQMAR